ncbi:MAG: DUF4350 domain-containing protein, partial [Myxococcota bacterium]
MKDGDLIFRAMRVAQALLLCALVGTTWPGGVCAQEGGLEYDPTSTDWNGLSDLMTLVGAEGVEVVLHEELDYGQLEVDQPIVLVYPGSALQIGSLERYVIRGGRMLLADDFGASDGFLERLDLSRVMPSGTLPHDEYADQNPALPILRPGGMHPLLEGVEVVVANHPAVLYNVGGPVVPYSVDGGLVYDMNLGEGKVVAL